MRQQVQYYTLLWVYVHVFIFWENVFVIFAAAGWLLLWVVGHMNVFVVWKRIMCVCVLLFLLTFL